MMMKTAEHLRDARRDERGAALITALLVSMLMLAAGGALLVTSGMTATNSVDSTAEAQAYYCAEAGVNSALSVLRGNVAPRSGLNLPAGTIIGNNFNTAYLLSTANLPSDTTNYSRLSGWLNYSVAGGTRVPLDSTNPNNGLSYSVALDDPSDPGRTQIIADPTYTPQTLRITATGYGPKGAVKRMELLVNHAYFDFTPRSTLLMRGADDCSDIADFNIGQSNAKTYSGNDAGTPPKSPLPVIGTTCAGNASQAQTTVDNSKPNTVTNNPNGKVAQISNSDLASWLQTADGARSLLNDLQAKAVSMGRYFTSAPADMGSSSNPQFTFVDGDCSLSGGSGLLVVTGGLTMSGNSGFNGIILVLGDGAMVRSGGGNGDILGAIVVAKFQRTWPASENGQPHPFLAPTFDTSGGGNSTVQYDSTEINKAMNSLGDRLLGMREF
jgi:Flp pilus assembly protein TadG